MSYYQIQKRIPFIFAIFLDGITIGFTFPWLYAIIVDPKTSFLANNLSSIDRKFFYDVVVFTYMLSWAWGSAFFSALSDKVGRKPVLIIAILGQLLGLLFMSMSIYVASLGLLILSRIIAGLTNAVQPEAEAIAVDISPSMHLRTNYIAYMLFPIAIGDFVGSLLIDRIKDFAWLGVAPLQRPILITALLLIVALFIFVLNFKETFSGDKSLVIRWHYPFTLFAHLTKPIIKISAVFILTIIGWSLFFVYLSSFSEKMFHLSEHWIDITLSIPGLGLIFAWGFLTPMLNRLFSPLKVFVLSKFTALLCVLLILLTSSVNIFWLMIFITSAASGVAYVTLLGVFAKLVSDNRQGWIMGLASAFHLLAFSIATIIATLFIDLQITILYFLSCTAIIVSIILALIFYQEFQIQNDNIRKLKS